MVLLVLFGAIFGPWPQQVCGETAAAPYSSRLEIRVLTEDIGTLAAGTKLGIFWVTPAQGWYAYGHTPGATGLPTTLQAMLAPDNTFLSVWYPAGIEIEDSLEPGVMVEAFTGSTPLFVVLPDAAILLEQDTLQTHLRMLLCSDRSCWPIDVREEHDPADLIARSRDADTFDPADREWLDHLQTASPGATTTPFVRPDTSPVVEGQTASPEFAPHRLEPISYQPGLEVRGLGKALLLALLGGLILNLTPCVLPVVSLKLRGLIPDASTGDLETQRKAFRDHNQLFALGILTFFMFLAFLLSLTGMVWGQIFQSPSTVIVLATLLLALSLSLFGVFNLPVIDLKMGRKGDSSLSSEGQAYFTGMLATLLATPCSGPFLGGVLAWTLIQPPLVVAGVFFCVGLGMASPYFVVSFFPSLVRFLPKPGNWTLYLEKALGFLLLATCIYLLTFLPEEFLFPVLILFWVTGMAAWIWGGWTNLSHSALRRWSIRAGALVLLLAAGGWALNAKPVSSEWEVFSADEFSQALGSDRMLVEFTAEWCPNCKFLEKTVLTPGNLAPLQDRYGFRLVRVDLTHDHPDGMALLRGLGSQSIPLVAIFDHGASAEQPLILRDLFTLGQLEQALETAFSAR
ncbi:cytochrome c biogenesis protein CcdA [Desulfonatronum thioautotrophicum]|uniref:cytochrome c biogenesis protein CcdA n=1 Tax=Desulfonatronum thioautotrophicum TaxID=617001 RepID=UPI0013792C89|nr:cytochrome c biogenesis protein CcdA [Desulfonatronum thioautotrophicum]